MLSVDILTEKEFWTSRPDRSWLSVAEFRRLMRRYVKGEVGLIEFLHAFVKPLDLNENLMPSIIAAEDMLRLALTFAFDDAAEISIDRFNSGIEEMLQLFSSLEGCGFSIDDTAATYYPQFYVQYEDHVFRCEEMCLINSQETGVVLSTSHEDLATSLGFERRNDRFEKVVLLTELPVWMTRNSSVALPDEQDIRRSVLAENAELYIILTDRLLVVPKGDVQATSVTVGPMRRPSHEHPYRFPPIA